MRVGLWEVTVERVDRGPFEAQRATDMGVAYGPVRQYRQQAIDDAFGFGRGSLVRNTRTGKVVWRLESRPVRG